MMRFLKIIFVLIIVLIGTSFSLINANPVEFNYYIGQAYVPLSLLLISVLALGVVIGLLFSLLVWLRIKLKNQRLQSRIISLEKEVSKELRFSSLKEV